MLQNKLQYYSHLIMLDKSKAVFFIKQYCHYLVQYLSQNLSSLNITKSNSFYITYIDIGQFFNWSSYVQWLLSAEHNCTKVWFGSLSAYEN